MITWFVKLIDGVSIIVCDWWCRQSVDEDEKVVNNVYTPGGVQNSWFLTENGLYEVLMLSRKPKAKEFKKKVKEILKTIRKTGGYINHDQEDLFIDTSCTHQSFAVFLYYQDPKEETTWKRISKNILSFFLL